MIEPYSGLPDNIDESEKYLAAQAQGYKFITLYLNPNSGVQKPRMAGVMVVDDFIDGEDENNYPIYSFVVQGGYLDFERDPKTRMLKAMLLDDDLKGFASPKGWNRDFLASHYERNLFIIPNEDVKADVEKRALLYKKIAEERKPKAPVEPTDLGGLIQEEEERMKKMQEHIDLLKEQKIKRELQPPEPPDLPPPQKSPEEIQKNKDWAAKMKAAREKKKTNGENQIKDLEKMNA